MVETSSPWVPHFSRRSLLVSRARSGLPPRNRFSHVPRFRSRDLLQHGIDGVSCIRQLHFHRHDRQRPERGKICPQIHRIFLCSNETPRLAPQLQRKQLANIFLDVSMVIAIESFRDRLNVCRPQLQHKILRPRDAAKHHRPRRNILPAQFRAALATPIFPPPETTPPKRRWPARPHPRAATQTTVHASRPAGINRSFASCGVTRTMSKSRASARC